MKLFSLTLISVVCCFISSCEGKNYEVIVYTGTKKEAGTLGKVYITLLGSKGNSPKIHLYHNGSEFFAGRASHFYISTEDIGDISKIGVELTEESYSPNWFLFGVTLMDLDEEQQNEQWFIWNQWLTPTADQKTISIEIPLYKNPNFDHFRPYRPHEPHIGYTVTVETGDEEDAGTQGKVYITLHGDEGHSRKINLDHEGKTEFQRGQTDIFHIHTENIGIVSKIRIELDSTEESHNPSWFLKTVSLEDKTRYTHQWFFWNQWLTPTEDQKKISVEIPFIAPT